MSRQFKKKPKEKQRRQPRQPRKPKAVAVVEVDEAEQSERVLDVLDMLADRAPVERPVAADVVVPSAWRCGGYLELVYLVSNRGTVYSFSTLDGEHKESIPNFIARMTAKSKVVNPHHLALNLVSRIRTGVCTVCRPGRMRVRTERILLAMLTEESLSSLSERQLAVEYKRIMGKGPSRISAAEKPARIAELLQALREEAAKVRADLPDEGNGSGEDTREEASSEEGGAAAPAAKQKPASESKPAEKSANTEGDTMKQQPKRATKKDKTTKGKAAAPKEKKPAPKPKAVKKEPAVKAAKADKPTKSDGGNPFREGTMKNKAYDFFLKVKGDRAKSIEFMEKEGATPSTARGWFNAFTHVGD